MLLTDSPSVTNEIMADCNLSGRNTIIMSIFWKGVNFEQHDGNAFYGYVC